MSNDIKKVDYPILMTSGEYFDYPCKIKSHKEHVITHQTTASPGNVVEAKFKECKECKDEYEKERPFYIFDGITATK